MKTSKITRIQFHLNHTGYKYSGQFKFTHLSHENSYTIESTVYPI